TMEFQVSEKAVYPGHGVGVITDIQKFELEGLVSEVYVLRILDNGLTISVPLQNASALGMRRVMSAEQVKKTFETLKDWDVPPDKQTWNRRFRQYTAQLHTGDPLEVGKVLRDLSLLRKKKPLSFGERKMYDKAHTLLVQELAVTRDIDEETIASEIELIFKDDDEDETLPGKGKGKKKKKKT
ncbi:MAG: CarD family transcriptional regulator, partial [Myxococcota bacterium]